MKAVELGHVRGKSCQMNRDRNKGTNKCNKSPELLGLSA